MARSWDGELTPGSGLAGDHAVPACVMRVRLSAFAVRPSYRRRAISNSTARDPVRSVLASIAASPLPRAKSLYPSSCPEPCPRPFICSVLILWRLCRDRGVDWLPVPLFFRLWVRARHSVLVSLSASVLLPAFPLQWRVTSAAAIRENGAR